jgi:hypothetical protein
MTEDRLALFERIDQSTDDDLVRDMLAFAAGRIMEMEVETRTGAAPGARCSLRGSQDLQEWLPRTGLRYAGWPDRTRHPEAAQGNRLPVFP